MNAHPGHVLIELNKLVLEETKYQSHILENGNGIVDFASYREVVGKLSALKKVAEFFEEAESNVEKRT